MNLFILCTNCQGRPATKIGILTHKLILNAAYKRRRPQVILSSSHLLTSLSPHLIGYANLAAFSHTCEGRRLGFCCCTTKLGEIAKRRSKKGILGHPRALEEGETHVKVKGSLGSPRSAHTCGGSSCCSLLQRLKISNLQ